MAALIRLVSSMPMPPGVSRHQAARAPPVAVVVLPLGSSVAVKTDCHPSSIIVQPSPSIPAFGEPSYVTPSLPSLHNTAPS